MVTEHRKQAHTEYMRKYRAEHPEIERRRQIEHAIRLLEKNGYTIVPPNGETKTEPSESLTEGVE